MRRLAVLLVFFASAIVRLAAAEGAGAYAFDGLGAGTFVIEVSPPNFSRLRRSGVRPADALLFILAPFGVTALSRRLFRAD
jgi:hypothetical protein